jgi:ankyrin repeat protein
VLHKAIYSGSADVVNLLVANSAHLDPEDDNFYTPLLLAEMSGKHDLADLLITLGADTKCCSKQGIGLVCLYLYPPVALNLFFCFSLFFTQIID